VLWLRFEDVAVLIALLASPADDTLVGWWGS
jgi:hypothetical protein